MYDIFEQLLQKKGLSTYKVAKETGIAQSVFSSWKNGISSPKSDKMQKIADYLNVSVDYLMNGEQKENAYYLNDETAQIAQEIFENKNLRVLFDVARDTSPERLKAYTEFLQKLKEQDNN